MHMASAYATFVLPLGHNLEKSNRKGNSISVVQVFLSRQACLCRTNIYITDYWMFFFYMLSLGGTFVYIDGISLLSKVYKKNKILEAIV